MAHDGHKPRDVLAEILAPIPMVSPAASNGDMNASRGLLLLLRTAKVPTTKILENQLGKAEANSEATMYIKLAGLPKMAQNIAGYTGKKVSEITAKSWQGSTSLKVDASPDEMAKGVVCLKGDPFALGAIAKEYAAVCGASADDVLAYVSYRGRGA